MMLREDVVKEVDYLASPSPMKKLDRRFRWF